MKPLKSVKELYELPADQPVQIAILDEVVELLRNTNVLWGKEIAEKLDANRHELNCAVHLLTGSTLDEMVKTWRKLQAIDLLTKTTLDYNAIAHTCGFRSEHYLSTFLDRETGLTSYEWREKNSNNHRGDEGKTKAKKILTEKD